MAKGQRVQREQSGWTTLPAGKGPTLNLLIEKKQHGVLKINHADGCLPENGAHCVYSPFLFDVSILALSLNSTTVNCRNKLFRVDNECFPNMLLLKITGSKCVTIWYTIHFLPLEGSEPLVIRAELCVNTVLI